MTLVDIKLDGWKPLRIPKAYLADHRNWRGGDQENVSIEVVYPSMQPRTLVPGSQESDVIFIDLMSAKKNLLESGNFKKNREMKPYLIPTEFGIGKLSDIYFEDQKLGKGPVIAAWSHDENYLASFAGRFIRIRCEKKNRYRCSVTTNFDENIMGYYSVSARFIPEHWQKVDENVIKLTKTFINFKDSEEK